jgi:hypothetical protein
MKQRGGQMTRRRREEANTGFRQKVAVLFANLGDIAG